MRSNRGSPVLIYVFVGVAFAAWVNATSPRMGEAAFAILVIVSAVIGWWVGWWCDDARDSMDGFEEDSSASSGRMAWKGMGFVVALGLLLELIAAFVR